MWAGARCSAVALIQGGDPVPPLPGVATPGAWLGDPFPPPSQRCVLYTTFPSRECVSLSLQTRRVLARSSRPAMGEFRSFAPQPRFALSYASSLRSLLSPRIARYARHRYAVFFSCRTELTHRRLNHSILSKNSTIYLTSRKWPFILIPCINHI